MLLGQKKNFSEAWSWPNSNSGLMSLVSGHQFKSHLRRPNSMHHLYKAYFSAVLLSEIKFYFYTWLPMCFTDAFSPLLCLHKIWELGPEMFGSTTSGGELNSQQLSGNQAVWAPSIIAEATSQAVLTPPPFVTPSVCCREEQKSYLFGFTLAYIYCRSPRAGAWEKAYGGGRGWG